MLFRAAAVCAAALLASCAGRLLLPERLTRADAVELRAVPFFPQQDYQCGPAALAMLLGASGVPVSPEELVPQVFLPGREGSLQLELVAATRRHGRVPLLISPELTALDAELRAGRPVLVLQNLGLGLWPRWHYAVVIGLDPLRDEFVLHSGVEANLRVDARRFLRSWKLAGNWGLSAVEPGVIPDSAREQAWLEAIASLEQAGQGASALRASESAVRRWPASAGAWFVLGNTRYAAADKRGAVSAFRESLRLDERPATGNNLASVLGELGCVAEARDLVSRMLAHQPSSSELGVLRQTAAELQSKPAGMDCGG